MKSKSFLWYGWIGKLGFPLLYTSMPIIIVVMSLQLSKRQGDYFYYGGYIVTILIFIFFLAALPKLQFIVCNDNGIAVKNMISQIVFISWDNIKDFGIIKVGFCKWAYVSNRVLTEKEKIGFEIHNKKELFIRCIYNKKLMNIIKEKTNSV